MSDRRMVFHLGFQKTGSTTVQAFLAANAGLLPDLEIRAYGAATQDLRTAGRGWCADPTSAWWNRLRDALDAHVARFASGRAQTCVISDENILGRVPWAATGDVVTWGEAVLPLIAERAAALAPEFVFYTRAPDPWLRSLYNQSVKRARVTVSYDDWRLQAPFAVDWDAFHQRFATAAGRPVTFLSMEEELTAGRPLGAGVLVCAGIAPERAAALPAAEARNVSLSEGALRLLRRINGLPLRDKQVLRLSEWIESREIRRGQ